MKKQSFALLLIMMLCLTAQSQEQLQKVKIASGGHIVHFLPLDLAVALDYFKDEGLEPQITYLKGGTATAQALISKQVDFSTNSIDHAFKAAAQGKDDLRMVVLLNQTPGMVLVVDSKYKDSVKTIADLKGKRLGVTSLGSATHMVLAYLLSKNGVNPSDVTVVKAGSSTFPPALKYGSIDGGIALEPFASIMVEQKTAFVLKRLITMKDTQQAFGGPYNQAGILTRQDVIDNDRELVKKVTCVLIRALKFIQEHTSEEITYVLSTEVTGSEKERYVKTLDLLREFYSPTGKIEPTGALNVLHSMSASGVLANNLEFEPKEFYDNSFVLEEARTLTPKAGQKARADASSTRWTNWSFWGFWLAILLIGVQWFWYKRNVQKIQAIHDHIKKVDFIETLDEFRDAVLERAENVKGVFNLALPLPVLYAVQNPEFAKEGYENSQWWKDFSGGLIEKLTCAAQKLKNNEYIRMQLVYLCDSQLRLRARQLLGDDTKVQDYVEVVDEFIAKLRSIPRVKVEADARVFNLPFWSLVVDPNLERVKSAIVCFTDPEDVSRKVEENGLSPRQIAQQVKGITISEGHAVDFFHRSFMDMKSRLYFYELVEQIRSDLTRADKPIDIAFIHKWEDVAHELEDKLRRGDDWKPHEVLVRSK